MIFRTFCLLCTVMCCSLCRGQSLEQQMTVSRPQCGDVLLNASELLPRLYAAGQFDSIRTATAIMNRFCNADAPEVTLIDALLDIQDPPRRQNWSDSGMHLLNVLIRYAATVGTTPGTRHKPFQYYYLPDDERKLFALVQQWATDLLRSRTMDNETAFVCRVLAGEIKNPESTIRRERATYPGWYALLHQSYETMRQGGGRILSLTAGDWIPTGNLGTLGAHTQLGFQIGGRGKSNELDLTLQFRPGNASHAYTVRRSDSLYTLNNFTGGYIGLDFAHYFYTGIHLEAGLMAGAGYDGFDISGNSSDHSQDYLKPWGIGSFNFNTGFRVNFFVNPRFFLGVVVRHHYISYHNPGGTSLDGNAFSIDLIAGSCRR